MQNHPSSPIPFDLAARAREEMRDVGFEPDWSAEALQQAAQTPSLPAPDDPGEIADLRDRLWSSIDNRESKDLDQIEFAEPQPNGVIRLFVGIADVDALVPEQSPVDRHAALNSISVYTGVHVFPMLPDALSTDQTSLLQDKDRLTIVVEMDIDADGAVTASRFYRAWTRNLSRLAYDTVGAWLEGEGPLPEAARVEGMEAQIRLQADLARRLQARRLREGALEFEMVEAQPVVEDGRITDLQVPRKNQARQIIENFMISANTTMADFLEARGVPSLQRVVRSPQRWPRMVEVAKQFGETLPPEPDPLALSQFLARRKAADPARYADLSLSIVKLMGPGEYAVVKSPAERVGHFGLAVYSYTHSTAPNRRYADLVVQRSLKAVLAGVAAPYSETTLAELAAHCTERENAARKVERFMRKAIAAVWLQPRIGETFAAIVTGVKQKGSYVRIMHPPVEGRVVRNEQGVDVGDHIRVRLIHTDPERGFIDFERVE